MDRVKITFDINHPGQDLCVAVRVDNIELWKATDPYKGPVEIEINDTEGDHELKIAMSGKQPHHTVVDDQGIITQDAVVEIKNLAFDSTQINHILIEKSSYEHDYNGTGTTIKEKFFGTMGCNGVVRLSFTTPIYIWLLEHT